MLPNNRDHIFLGDKIQGKFFTFIFTSFFLFLSVFVSYGGHNKVAQVGWLLTADVNSLSH